MLVATPSFKSFAIDSIWSKEVPTPYDLQSSEYNPGTFILPLK
jgi:hypothetical protein